jgi:hypothetical protein
METLAERKLTGQTEVLGENFTPVQLHPQHDLELNPESHDVGNWSTQSTTA